MCQEALHTTLLPSREVYCLARYEARGCSEFLLTPLSSPPLMMPCPCMEKLQPRGAVLPAQGHTARRYGGTWFELDGSGSWGPSPGLPQKEWKIFLPWAGVWQEMV